jgi:hypothetical protein
MWMTMMLFSMPFNAGFNTANATEINTMLAIIQRQPLLNAGKCRGDAGCRRIPEESAAQVDKERHLEPLSICCGFTGQHASVRL